MNNGMRGIVPTAKPKPAAATTSAAPAGVARMPPPAGFDPKKFMAAMNTIPTSWSQLSVQDKLVRVMAYLPSVKNPDAFVGAITATDEYAYRVTSPHGPLLKGVPGGKASPTVVSPMQPQSTVGVEPRNGIITDVPQPPIAPPHVDIPKPLVVFDPKTGKMVVPGARSPIAQGVAPSSMQPARQADQSGGLGFVGYLLTFVAGFAVGSFFMSSDETPEERMRREYERHRRAQGWR